MLLLCRFKVIPLFCIAQLILRITLRLRRFHAGHLKKAKNGRFCCSRAFNCNHDNSSWLRRCCCGTRPSPLMENDHFDAEIAPLPSIYRPVGKKRVR